MNFPVDDERWTLGRDAIEREKGAARTWLAGRDWNAAGIVRKPPQPSRRPKRTARLAAAAAGAAILFLGFLLLRPVFHPRSSGVLGPAESILKVFERVQTESAPSSSLPAILNEAADSEVAWSIQGVLCAAALHDAVADGLPRLIESALKKSRRDSESPTAETGRKGLRRSNLSDTFLRIFQSIKEG